MREEYYVTDMAVESAEGIDFGSSASRKTLSYGIEKRAINIKTLELARQIGKERGVYITYDCERRVLEGKTSSAYLANCLASSIKELVGITKKNSPILIVGLGNRNIVSDSLGDEVVSKVSVTRHDRAGNVNKQSVCAIAPGVLGTTGMQTAEIVGAITDKIKPCAVILVDALATGAAKRLGRSFQICNSGISPGSGAGQDKERIDKSVLGVPTISLGVPLMLSLKTSVYTFLKEYLQDEQIDINEFSLRRKMADDLLSNLIVASKDIDYSVGLCSSVVANAINFAFDI